MRDGAQCALTSNALVNNQHIGLLGSGDGTIVEAEANLIEGTLPRKGDLDRGGGILLILGTKGKLLDNAIVGNRFYGVGADQVEMLEVVGNLVEGTLPELSSGEGGMGVALTRTAGAVQSNAILSSRMAGLYVHGVGTNLVASGNSISHTQSDDSDETLDQGVYIANEASVALTDNLVLMNQRVGIAVGEAGTHLEAHSNLVQDTQPEAASILYGMGAQVDSGAQANFISSAFVGNRRAGLLVDGQGSVILLKESVVEGTFDEPMPNPRGMGVQIQNQAEATTVANAVLGNHFCGIELVGEGTKLESTGDFVSGTLPIVPPPGPWVASEFHGMGVAAFDGAEVVLRDCVISENHGAAVELFSSQATIERCMLRGTRYSKLSMLDESAIECADGLLAVGNSSVDVIASKVQDCERVGVLLDQCKGSISSTNSVGNGKESIVIQCSSEVLLGDGNTWEGHEGGVLETCGDGSYSVPDKGTVPPELPAGSDEPLELGD